MKDKKDKENKSEKKISIFEKTGIKGGLLVLPVICFAVMMVCLCYGVVNFVTQRYPEIKLVVGNEPVSSAESLEEITGEGSDTMETETEPPETETETETETESRTEPYTPSTSKPQSSYTPKPKPQATEPVTEAVKHVAPEYSTYWSGEKNITYVEGELPTLGYESQFATLNVEGWSKKNLKVYVG